MRLIEEKCRATRCEKESEQVMICHMSHLCLGKLTKYKIQNIYILEIVSGLEHQFNYSNLSLIVRECVQVGDWNHAAALQSIFVWKISAVFGSPLYLVTSLTFHNEKKYGMFFTLRVQGWLYLLRLTDFHRVPDASTYPRNNRRSGPLINPQKGQVYLYLCSNLKPTKKKHYKNSKTLPPVRWGSSTHLHWHSWQFGSPAPFLKWFRFCILVAPVSSALFFNVQRLNSL